MTKANQFLSVFVLASAGALEEANKNNLWFVSWNAPFLASSSGYGSEATSFLLGLEEILENNWTVAAGLAHGDAVDYEYVSRLPDDLLTSLQKAEDNQRKITSGTIEPSQSIFICHSEPGAWSVPTPFYQSASPCPWPGVKWHKVVGRTMFETDRLPVGWEDRLNQMDEVWVPTQHHKQIFERDGVTKPVRVVGQGIDVDFWNPERVEPLEWSTIDPNGSCDDSDYKFLSVFKWEKRKGPDVLLPSFWNAFPQGKGACLIIVTSLYHEKGAPVLNKINNYWKQSNPETVGKSPQGVVLLSGLPLEDLVRLYRSVDSFVLPSRGEGWGRPYMEAMAMGKPVIATNWSGPTEFVSEHVGYLLPTLGLVDAKLEAFPKHQWAEPDGKELERLLKHLKEHREEARRKGENARAYVVQHWSNTAVSKQVASHLERLAEEPSDNDQSREEL